VFGLVSNSCQIPYDGDQDGPQNVSYTETPDTANS